MKIREPECIWNVGLSFIVLVIFSVMLILVSGAGLFASENDDVDFFIRWQYPDSGSVEFMLHQYRTVDLNTGGFTIEDSTTYTTSLLEYKIDGLDKDRRYFYKVRAFNEYGYSGYSNQISGLVISDTAATFVQDHCRIDSRNILSETQVEILWSTLYSAEGMIIYGTHRDSLYNETVFVEGEFAQEHIDIMQNLVPGKYYFRAKSWDESMNMVISAIDSIEIKPVPSPPIFPSIDYKKE